MHSFTPSVNDHNVAETVSTVASDDQQQSLQSGRPRSRPKGPQRVENSHCDSSLLQSIADMRSVGAPWLTLEARFALPTFASWPGKQDDLRTPPTSSHRTSAAGVVQLSIT